MEMEISGGNLSSRGEKVYTKKNITCSGIKTHFALGGSHRRNRIYI